jgi:type IV pilus assembly protein PilV
MMRSPSSVGSRGFSLVEVMVAVVVICVGLLGIAKMQALALSNTTIARQRSLAAMQAASLASAMHSNREYWAGAAPPATFTSAQGGNAIPVVASSDANLATGVTAALPAWPTDPTLCMNFTCSNEQLAAFDVAWWLVSLNNLLPNPSSSISCQPVAPVACIIQISWTENVVNNNSGQTNAPNAQQFQTPTYTLYVEP